MSPHPRGRFTAYAITARGLRLRVAGMGGRCLVMEAKEGVMAVHCAVCGKLLQSTRHGYEHLSRRRVNHAPVVQTEDLAWRDPHHPCLDATDLRSDTEGQA